MLPRPREFIGGPRKYRAGRGSIVPLDLHALSGEKEEGEELQCFSDTLVAFEVEHTRTIKRFFIGIYTGNS